ncbi:MAG: aldehyde dehydrogenase family protein [Verrucomicrobia bacterium]|nr:aldehyde dehydrogenase family protein [Verrucomicrobiota bacterium]
MIASPLLTRLGGYLDGGWVEAGAGGEAAVEVRNPATGELLARLPALGEAEATAAVVAADRALAMPPTLEQRRDWLAALEGRLLAAKDELARIITLENGKPLREAVGEVEYAAGFFGFSARQVLQLEPERLAEPIRGCAWTVRRRPAGVVGLITPWNFPLAMLAKKVAAALAAGCTLVVKPSELTPLAAVALVHLCAELPLPPGRISLLVGPPEPTGTVLCRHPAVRRLSFTGSTAVGRLLLAQAAPHIKRVALELGGNAPFLVFADADLEGAATALLANKFRAGGQTCVCANRVLVEHSVFERFVRLVADRVRRLRVGNGLDPATDIGPLIHRAAFDKVAALVADALARGARRMVGYDPPRPATRWGAFYPPTVLADVVPEMRLWQEEIFGPVVALGRFEDEAEATAMANGTVHGLAAYLFTQDQDRAQRMMARLEFGHVGLNTGSGPTPEVPFGGMKQSGFGREGGLEGLLEYCETQAVVDAGP